MRSNSLKLMTQVGAAKSLLWGPHALQSPMPGAKPSSVSSAQV
jgi:hypothetical protein